MLADIELTGVVADDDGVGEEAVRPDAAPQRPLGRDHHGIRIDLEGRDAERFKMCVPGLATDKATLGCDHSSCVTLRLRFNLPQPGVSIIRAAPHWRDWDDDLYSSRRLRPSALAG